MEILTFSPDSYSIAQRDPGCMATERSSEGICIPDQQFASGNGHFVSMSRGNLEIKPHELLKLIILSSYTWANEVCAGDNEERALVISSMNGMQYAVDAWLPIVIFPQTMAPSFRKYKQARQCIGSLVYNVS